MQIDGEASKKETLVENKIYDDKEKDKADASKLYNKQNQSELKQQINYQK